MAKRHAKNNHLKKWNPSHFIDTNQNFCFGPWELKPILLTGHTKGHLVLYEKNVNAFFLGDFIYDGTLYLHLSDSSFEEFQKSLEVLKQTIHKCSEQPLLLPCHDTIPLQDHYIERLERVIQDIKTNKLQGKRENFPSDFFEESLVFEKDNIRIALKTSEVF
ncbi:MAG: hypothetical protein H7A33_07305 [Deltaproteobacteria bacterium]|nr:hypothetical protein [Deltaproteobacteria bacterium]